MTREELQALLQRAKEWIEKNHQRIAENERTQKQNEDPLQIKEKK